jgi:hypothetical protein
MSLLPASMTSSLIQAAHARIFAFRKKSPAGSGAGDSDREVEHAQGGIDHVDLAEAGQKLIGNSRKASRQRGHEVQRVETPVLRRVDLTA